MEECIICLSEIKKRNKNKHEQSKKHKCFSNLIINKYIAKVCEFYIFKDIIQPHYSIHKKKIDNFTICIMWKKNDVLINKISVPSTITLKKQHLFKPSMAEMPIVGRVQSLDYQDTFDTKCINDKVDEIKIIFISDP